MKPGHIAARPGARGNRIMNIRNAAILREAWQRHLVADRTILVSDLKSLLQA